MKRVSKDKDFGLIRPIALSVAIMTGIPISTQAAIIEMYTESTYSMGVGAASTLSDGPKTTGWVDVLKFENSGSNSIGLHSYGSDVGDFGSRSSGAGVYDVTGLFRIKERLTNTSGAAASASFSFNITPGLLSNEIRTTLGTNEFVEAAISFQVIATRSSAPANPQTVWFSSASLVSTESLMGQFSASGDDTNFYVVNPFYGQGFHYDVQSFSKSLDLGLLNPGETLDLTYQIRSSARGNSIASGETIVVPPREVVIPGHWEWTWGGFDTSGEGTPGNATNGLCYGGGEFLATVATAVNDGYGGYGGYGGDPGKPPTDSPCWTFVGETTEILDGYEYPTSDPSGSQASSGDPFQLSLDPNDPNFAAYYNGLLPIQGGLRLANVPEPGALSLLGLGLIAGLISRRRKH